MCIGVPLKILSVYGHDELRRVARVQVDLGEQQVSLACVPEAQVGDYVIVHAGIAMSHMDEDEALGLLEELRQITSLGAEELAPTER